MKRIVLHELVFFSCCLSVCERRVRAARANQTANYSRTHKPVIRALGAANHWFAPRETSTSSSVRGLHSYPGFMNFCSITISIKPEEWNRKRLHAGCL